MKNLNAILRKRLSPFVSVISLIILGLFTANIAFAGFGLTPFAGRIILGPSLSPAFNCPGMAFEMIPYKGLPGIPYYIPKPKGVIRPGQMIIGLYQMGSACVVPPSAPTPTAIVITYGVNGF